jgi:uncharacterized protein (DUF885 family)
MYHLPNKNFGGLKMKKNVHRYSAICILLIISTILTSGCDLLNSQPSPDLSTLSPEHQLDLPTFTPENIVVIDEILDGLKGLPLNNFFEESFLQLGLRIPENMVALGIAESVGLDEITLNNISDSYIKNTQALETGILEILRTFDRASLSPEDQISYDVYEWYLDDLVRGHEFMYYDYPTTFFLFSVHNSTEFFFTDNHPFTDKQDAEDYVTRLSLVDDKFNQLIEGLKKREELGIIPPRYTLQWGLQNINNNANVRANQTSYYSSFENKLNSISGIDNSEKETLLENAEKAIQESVIPAYKELRDYINDLIDIAPTDDGVWQFPNGDAYYAHVLRHHNSTEFTPDEIHELGIKELERIHSEMREIFDDLGYPEDENLAQLFERTAQDGGIVPGHRMVETYEALIDEMSNKLPEVFDTLPQAEVVVIGASVGGFYSPGSIDGSRPGAFYAEIDGRGEPYYLMASLAYHETIPGHHTQSALAQEAGTSLPTFRNFIELNGYLEGWALYAERLAWEMGMYADDPYGNLGRLQYEALRAARLVVDTGIHDKGWTFDQATDFFVESIGWSRQDCEYEIARYTVWPGQSTSYMIGMLKILELRQNAMDQLGNQFDLKEFHNVVLVNGSMPLSILEDIIQNYISEKLASSS